MVLAGDAAERRLVAAGGQLHDTPADGRRVRHVVAVVMAGEVAGGDGFRSCHAVLRRAARDESVAAFARRRLGVLAGERLLQPLVSGLYAGDPEQVSLPSAFPLVAAMERDRRSFLLAMRREFAAAKAEDRTATGIVRAWPRRIDRRAGRASRTGFALGGARAAASRKMSDELPRRRGGARRTGKLEARAVVLALPAHVATSVLVRLDGQIAETLAHIPYVPVTLVHLGYPISALSRAIDAYGFFVPPSEPLRVLGGIFPSQFFRRARRMGFHLFSVRTGGARHPEAFTMPDAELVALCRRRVARAASASPRARRSFTSFATSAPCPSTPSGTWVAWPDWKRANAVIPVYFSTATPTQRRCSRAGQPIAETSRAGGRDPQVDGVTAR